MTKLPILRWKHKQAKGLHAHKLKKTNKAVPRSLSSNKVGGKSKRRRGRGSNLCANKFIFSAMSAFVHKLWPFIQWDLLRKFLWHFQDRKLFWQAQVTHPCSASVGPWLGVDAPRYSWFYSTCLSQFPDALGEGSFVSLLNVPETRVMFVVAVLEWGLT